MIVRVEIIMVVMTGLTALIFVTMTKLPQVIAIILAVLLAQRVAEFFFIYSRHFIFNEGLIFSQFQNANELGRWLIIMFGLSLSQVILVFATWYQLLSQFDPAAFSQSLDRLGSLYFSLVTFLTIGYGDVVPVSALARLLVIAQGLLTFYTLVIVINGMISIHFSVPTNSGKEK